MKLEWFIFRLAEIKVELVGNYKRSALKYKQNGFLVIRVDDESEDHDGKSMKKEKVSTKDISLV